MATVRELIAFLKKQPQDIDVAYCLFSDQCLLEISGIVVIEASNARPDGWIESKRPDKPTKKYLLFPGN